MHPMEEGPNYLREIYPYTQVPLLTFDGHEPPMAMPAQIWITDTTFRDGQQAREPYSVEQIVRIYDLLSQLDAGVRPRCHLEDLTRADVQGFVLPFARELMKLAREANVPIKIRLCDTMGFGVPWAAASLPRSVPKLVRAMIEEAGVPGEWLE